jgi:Bacterial Ig domain/Cadherin domain/RTX calcium-binding nonapeptide repeat (4 copies)
MHASDIAAKVVRAGRTHGRRSSLVALVGMVCAVLLSSPLPAALRSVASGTQNDCTIDGTPGADVLTGTLGDDVICGFGGDDVLRAGPGEDRLLGGTGDDRLFGGGDNDRLLGDGGDDVLDGGGGSDNLRGGVGADVFRGGPGSDLADYLNSDEAVTLSIAGAADGSKGEGDNIRADVENLRGGSGNDSLRGNAGENWLNGFRGNDRVRAGAGDDRLYGGAGSDTLDARDSSAFSDEVSCGTGDDTALADSGDSVGAGCEKGTRPVAPTPPSPTPPPAPPAPPAPPSPPPPGPPPPAPPPPAPPPPPPGSAPTDVSLSNSSVQENEPVGTAVGTLTTTDPDVGDTHSYSLVAGTGDADNGSFAISGDTLETDAVLDADAKSTYSIRVRTTDSTARSLEKQFTVTATGVNEAPTDIGLSSSSVPENEASGTAVGTLSSVDPDAGDTHSYELVAGSGDTDNGSFAISGTSLETNDVFDFEAKSSYSIRVRSTDAGSLTFEKVFTVLVTNVNEGPTDIVLSSSTVPENEPSGTTVGTLSSVDPDSGDTHSYELVSGTGDTDNGSFTVDGASLQTDDVFDFEAKSSYSIRVRSTDAGSLTFEKAFTIPVSNVNEAPADIALSSSTVAENQVSGTAVGALSATDPDAADTHSFSLVSGTGDSDNGSFAIVGSSLRTSEVFDFEIKNSYSIRVRATDNGLLTFEKEFTISVSNVNEAPTDIALSNGSVAENQASGTTVGALSAIDPEPADTHSFILVSGPGSADNGSFAIVGSSLRTSEVFDFEIKNSYSIRVRATDNGGLSFEKQLTVTVSNVNEGPTDIALSSSTVAENQAPGTTVGTLSSVDPDSGDTHSYELVSGSGDTDNGSFTIDGTSLQTDDVFDFEAKSSYSIRVRSTDAGSLTVEKAFTVTVTNVNENPTDIALSNSSAAENQASGTTVGALSASDPDAADTHSFSLVSGTGSADNGSFAIVGSSLRTSEVFDFEAKNSYSIRVRATDNGLLTFEKQFTISVTNVNEAPTDIALSNSSLAENQPSGTTVGALSATDPEPADTHVFSLVAGTGSTDNGSFTIVGTSLRTNAIFNFEAKSSYSIRVRVTDTGGLSFEKVFTISVTNVNEAPTDIGLSPASVPENEVSGTDVGTLSSTDPDTGDTFTYSLVAGTGSTDNGSFTITGSTLNTNAVFDFETKSSYSIRVRSTDGGSLTFEKVFTIAVVNVNEAPVNTVPGAQTVNEDTDLSFTGLSVSDVDAGTNNVQTTVSAVNGTITPATGSGATITGSGTASAQITGTLTQVNAALNGLKYKGTANWNSTRGTETLTIATNDQGNTGTGGAKSDTDTVGITVSAVNDKPVATAKSFAIQTNMQRNLTALLDGATDPDSGDGGYTASFTLAGVTVGSGTCSGCTISNVNPNGTVDVDPPGGATGSLTINYTITDSGNPGPAATSDPQTITLTISGPVIWFVNSASGNDTTGRGTLAAPFQTIAKVDTVDAASQSIFLYSGTYASGITLNTGEKLVGQGASGPASFDALFAISPPAGTIARPAINTGTATVQNTVTLASQALLRGLALSTGTATALSGTGPFSGIDVSQVSVTTTTGTAVNLNNAVGSYSFSSITTNGAANAILLATPGASTFTATGGSIAGASTRGIDIDGGSGNVSYGGTISTSGAGRSVEVTNRTGGTAALNGAITDNGSGINLSSNTGATVNFTGGISASTGANGAFSATGGGTVSVTGSANTLASTSGVALNVQNTTIGASGLTFRSIAANGAPNGIVLTNTGSSGGLTVVGTGAANSGGTIANTTGSAIALTNTTSPSFNNMLLQDAGDHGVGGTQVTNFRFTNGSITGAGNASDEAAISFDDSLTGVNLSGVVTITGNTISQPDAHGVDILNGAGTLSDVTISDNTMTGDGPGPVAGSGINVLALGSATAVGNITKVTITNNTINEFNEAITQVRGGNCNDTAGAPAGTVGVPGSASDVITITGNLASGGAGDIGQTGDRFFTGGVCGRGQGNFNISNNGTAANPITNIDGVVIELQADGPAIVTSRIADNWIVARNAVGSAGIAPACDADSLATSTDNGSMTTTVTGNHVSQTDGPGIFTLARGVSSCTLNATVTNNTVAAPKATNAARAGIRVDSGSSGSTTTVCLDLRGNTTAGSTNTATGTTSPGINLRRQIAAGVVFGIEGMTATDSPGVENYVNGLNTSTSGTFGVDGTALLSATTGFSNCSTAP